MDYTGMTSKLDNWRKRKIVNNEEGWKGYKRLRNKLISAKEKAKREYLEQICDEIIEFQKLDFMI